MKYFFTDKSIGIDTNKLQKKVGKRKLIFMNQIHSANVKVVDKNSPSTILKTDAMITTDKDVALGVKAADCIPVIFIDEIRGAVGVAHAGRVGSYKGVVKKTIKKMVEEFTCKEENIKIILGPSIKKCCYEVGVEVIGGFEEFTHKRDNKIYLDLIELNTKELNNFEVIPTCTCCDENYFSYRRDATKERFCGVAYV
jgi:YfiH family protein